MIDVCIVGLGLIGGSMGLGLRRVRTRGKRSYRVSGFDRDASQIRRAKARGAIDSALPNLKAIGGADVVVLAVPVQATAAVVQKIIPNLKKGAVLTDVGSVKFSVERDVRRALRRR